MMKRIARKRAALIFDNQLDDQQIAFCKNQGQKYFANGSEYVQHCSKSIPADACNRHQIEQQVRFELDCHTKTDENCCSSSASCHYRKPTLHSLNGLRNCNNNNKNTIKHDTQHNKRSCHYVETNLSSDDGQSVISEASSTSSLSDTLANVTTSKASCHESRLITEHDPKRKLSISINSEKNKLCSCSGKHNSQLSSVSNKSLHCSHDNNQLHLQQNKLLREELEQSLHHNHHQDHKHNCFYSLAKPDCNTMTRDQQTTDIKRRSGKLNDASSINHDCDAINLFEHHGRVDCAIASLNAAKLTGQTTNNRHAQLDLSQLNRRELCQLAKAEYQHKTRRKSSSLIDSDEHQHQRQHHHQEINCDKQIDANHKSGTRITDRNFSNLELSNRSCSNVLKAARKNLEVEEKEQLELGKSLSSVRSVSKQNEQVACSCQNTSCYCSILLNHDKINNKKLFESKKIKEHSTTSNCNENIYKHQLSELASINSRNFDLTLAERRRQSIVNSGNRLSSNYSAADRDGSHRSSLVGCKSGSTTTTTTTTTVAVNDKSSVDNNNSEQELRAKLKTKQQHITNQDERAANQKPFKPIVTSRSSLPASLRKTGHMIFGQNKLATTTATTTTIDDSQELINNFKKLKQLEEERRERAYKPMNWKHIARIYQQHRVKIAPNKNSAKISSSKKSGANFAASPSSSSTSNVLSKGEKTHSLGQDNPMYLKNYHSLDDTTSGSDDAIQSSHRYGHTTCQQQDGEKSVHNNGRQPSNFGSRLRHSCLCQLLVNMIHDLFPILHAFDDYSLPSDLFSDLFIGLTIAILQVPQGMAYGMLAGVEPIYGLYVSLIPVLVMAFLSKSRHVSYGTFAIISILLASSTDSIKKLLIQNNETYMTTAPTPNQLNLVRQQTTLNQASRIGNVVWSPPEMIIAGIPSAKSINNQDPTIVDQDSTAPFQDDYQFANSIESQLQQQVAFVMPSNIEILTTICITVGLLQVLMALFRLGHLSVIFSDQLVSSFTTASAIHVLTSQLTGLFDLEHPNLPDGLFKVCRTWWHVGKELISSHDDGYGFNHYTAILSLISILFLLIVKELLEPWLRLRCKSIKCLPSELILMTFIILSSWHWKFNANFNIKIVGHIPTGLPAPKMPRLDLIPYTLQDALTIALVSFAMNLSLAQVYAKRFRYKMNSNQELFALGGSNLVGSFFSCFPCASSLSRSALQSNMNARSPLAPIFSCAIVFSIICYFAPILHDLPKSTLSCIIVIALKGIIMQYRDFFETWRLSKLDASTWLITFWAVIACGVTYGLVIGILSSLLTIFFRILTPNYSILGRLPGTEIYVDKEAFGDYEEIDEVKIFRFNSPLCYMNRTMFKARVESALPEVYKRRLDYMKVFCPRKQMLLDTTIDQNKNHNNYQIMNNNNKDSVAICDSSKNNNQISSLVAHKNQYKPMYDSDTQNGGGLINAGFVCDEPMRRRERVRNECKRRVRFFIIDCSALAYCDHSGANLLLELIQELEEHKVTVLLAACPIKLILMIERLGHGSVLETNVYPTITAAVSQAKYMATSRCHTTIPTIYCR